MTVRNEPQKLVTACPDCGQRIALRDKTVLGQRFVCIRCGTELKVVETAPLRLGRAYSV